MLKQWNARNEIISLGQDKVALNELSSLRDVMIDSGIKNAPAVTIAILNEIEERKAELSESEITSLAEAAKKISPDLPAVRFKIASIYFTPKTFSLKKGFAELYNGMDLILGSIESRLDLYANLLYWTALSLVAAVIMFLAVWTLKYLKLLHHMLRHALPKIFSGFSIYVILSAAVVFSFFYFGPLSILIVLILYFWFFMNGSEKSIAVLFLVLAALSPFMLDLLIFSAKYSASPERSMLALELSPDYQSNVSRFGSLLAKNRDDNELKFSMALIQKRTGNLNASKELLTGIVKNRPEWDKAFVNLGNVEFLQGNFDFAISDYKKATSLNPGNFLAKYNLGKALYRKTRLEDANQELSNASNIDPLKFKELEDISDPKNPLRYVFDETLSPFDLKERIKSLSKADEGARKKLWEKHSLTTLDPLATSAVNVSFIILLFVLAGFSRKIDPPKRCTICGNSYCRRCSKTTDKRDICSQCYYIFVLRDSIDPAFKTKKETQEAKNKFTNGIFKNWISYFIPGFGCIYAGNAFSGFLITFTSSWAVFYMIFRKGILADKFFASLEPSVFLPLAMVVFALAVHILSNIIIRRLR